MLTNFSSLRPCVWACDDDKTVNVAVLLLLLLDECNWLCVVCWLACVGQRLATNDVDVDVDGGGDIEHHMNIELMLMMLTDMECVCVCTLQL